MCPNCWWGWCPCHRRRPNSSKGRGRGAGPRSDANGPRRAVGSAVLVIQGDGVFGRPGVVRRAKERGNARVCGCPRAAISPPRHFAIRCVGERRVVVVLLHVHFHVDPILERRLLDVGQQVGIDARPGHAPHGGGRRPGVVIGRPGVRMCGRDTSVVAGRQDLVHVVEVMRPTPAV